MPLWARRMRGFSPYLGVARAGRRAGRAGGMPGSGASRAPAGRRVCCMVRAQRNVLLLAADDFEDMELLYPLYRLREEDVAVTVAGLDDHPVTGKKGHGPVPVDATVEQVAADDFDALVIPGGYAPDKLRRSEAVLALVRAFDDAGKPIAFICHAGWVPISAKIAKGRRATSVAAIRDDMVNAGVDWVDQAAVVDGNLISARTPADLGPWMKALLAALDHPRS
jgi:protease I